MMILKVLKNSLSITLLLSLLAFNVLGGPVNSILYQQIFKHLYWLSSGNDPMCCYDSSNTTIEAMENRLTGQKYTDKDTYLALMESSIYNQEAQAEEYEKRAKSIEQLLNRFSVSLTNKKNAISKCKAFNLALVAYQTKNSHTYGRSINIPSG